MEIFGKNKLYDHVDKLNNWLNKDNTIITAELDMTNICDNKCPGCTGFNDNQVSLSFEEAKNYIDQLADLKVKGIVFTGGGEPLCNKHTLEVMEYAKKKGLDVGLITNGLKMEPYTFDFIAINCTWVRISLDAAEHNLYKLTHGMEKKSFDKVMKNISGFVKSCKGYIDKPTIGTAFLTSEKTKDQMYNFALASKLLGVDYAQFRPFHYDRTDVSKEIENCKTLETKDFKVVSSSQKYKYFKDKDIRPYKKCYGINFRIVIAADSKVYACCHHRANPKYCLGDLKKNSLREILRNRDEMIDKIDFKDCPPFCILDKVNRELYNIKEKRDHKNFL